jgi:hypothetical protein
VSAGKHVLLADLRQENADAAAKVLSGAGFITGSDFLMGGGVTAAYWFGELGPK